MPENLVSQQVASAGELGRVEQTRLDGDPSLCDQRAEVRPRDLRGIRPERADVRVEPDPPESPRVDQNQAAAVREPKGEAAPPSLPPLGGVAARIPPLGHSAG